MEKEQVTTNDLVGIIKRSFDGVDQKFDKINERFDGIDERFNGVDEKLEGVDQILIGTNQRLDKLAENQGVIMSKLEGVVYRKEFDELKSRIEAVENALSAQN